MFRLLALLPVLAAGLTVTGDESADRASVAFQLGEESRAGDRVCDRTMGPAGEPATDHWTYRAIVSRSSGLVLTDIRLGPRLMADAAGVAYVRIRTADGVIHNGFLTPTPVAQPDSAVASRLRGAVDCAPVEGDDAVTAAYAVTVGDATVLFEQQYRFSNVLDKRCEPTLKSRCKRFWPTTRWAVSPADRKKIRSVSVVQRFAWNPDDGVGQGSAGGAELIKDELDVGSSLTALKLKVTTLSGGNGHLRLAGTKKVIDRGEVRGEGWENYHQTSRHGVGLPTPISAGCSECVHVHWSWFADPLSSAVPLPQDTKTHEWFTEAGKPTARLVASQVACGGCLDGAFSDGRPQIPDGSRQTACIGWTTHEPTSPVDWCQSGDELRLDPAKPPVMYWDATSDAADELEQGVSIGKADYATGDAYWQKLPDRRHGGDGSLFFVPARRLATPEEDAGGATTATIEPVWPAKRGGPWLLPVRITLDRDDDQGPYYLRVKSREARLLKADSSGSASPGDPVWVTIRNGSSDGSGQYSSSPIVAGRTPSMAANLIFDREPKPEDLSFRLDAAPDGVPGYVPSDGTWTDPPDRAPDRAPDPAPDPAPDAALDAAPDGISAFVPSDGASADPSTVGDAPETIDWLAVVRRHLTDCNADKDTSEVALAEDFPPRVEDVNDDGQDDVFVGAKCRESASAALLYLFDGASDSRDPQLLDVVDGRGHPVFDLDGATLGTTDDTVKIYATNPRDADGEMPYRDIELTLEWHDRLKLTRIDTEDCTWPAFYSGDDDPAIVCH
ncbi:hypothetical protein ACQPZJ_14875 [Actinoplanes sp. CA-054009]